MVQGIQDTKVMKHHNISDDDNLDNLNNFIVESPSNKVVNIRFKVFNSRFWGRIRISYF